MEQKKYRQTDEFVDRIDWDNIMKMERYAGGHDCHMKGLLKNITVLAHCNIGSYDGVVATMVKLNDTSEILIYDDYYGSCSGCDAWEDASDNDVIDMCKQLVCGAYVFKTKEDAIEFLRSKKTSEQSIDQESRDGLLKELEM